MKYYTLTRKYIYHFNSRFSGLPGLSSSPQIPLRKVFKDCWSDIFTLTVTKPPATKHMQTRKPCYRKDDRAMRPIYGCPEKFRESSQTPPATFPEICKGLLFRSILRMCIQNLKFVALSVPEIIGGTQFGQSLYTPRSSFSQIFNRLLFVWTLWIYLPNLKFVALPIPEIIRGTPKIWGVPGFAHAPYSPKFLKGFCLYGPSEYTCQIWSS